MTFTIRMPEEAAKPEGRYTIKLPRAARDEGRALGDTSLGAAGQALLTVAQGPTLGFADEIAGGIGGLKSLVTGGNFNDGYEGARDYVRGANDRYREDHPVLGTVAELSGGLLTAPIAAGAAMVRPAVTGLGRMGQAIGIGAAQGAVSGAGEADAMADVPAKAMQGSILGGGSAGALHGGSGMLKATRDNVVPRFSGTAASEIAQRRLATSLVRDEKSGEQVARRLDKLGEEGTIADAAGQNTRHLLDTMATLPGKTQNRADALIRQRQAGRAERLDEVADRMSGGKRFDEAYATLQTEKEEASRPLYDAIRNVEVKTSPTMFGLTERPIMREAIEQARVNAANRGQPFPENETGAVLTVGTWDEIKRGLDDVISAKKRGLDTRDPNNKFKAQSTLRAAVETKNALLRELDTVTGGQYKAARDAYAGPAAMQSSMEDGLKALEMKPGEINALLFKASNSEKEAFRIGAAEALRERVGTSGGQTRVLNAWKDRNTQMQMRSIFGDERQFREAMSTIAAEERLKRLESVGRGSQTAGREARIDDFTGGALDDAMSIAKSASTGNVMGLIGTAKNMAGRVQIPEAVRDEIGRLLMLKGGSAQDQARNLENIIRAIEQSNAQSAAVSGVLGGNLFNP